MARSSSFRAHAVLHQVYLMSLAHNQRSLICLVGLFVQVKTDHFSKTTDIISVILEQSTHSLQFVLTAAKNRSLTKLIGKVHD